MGSMGNKAAGKACECKVKNKDNWRIISAVLNSRKKIIATCSCSECRNWWETSASYIKKISGSDWYQELFEVEKDFEILSIRNRLKVINDDIADLNKEKVKLEKRLAGILDIKI